MRATIARRPIKAIVVHKGAHLDELVAVTLLLTSGESVFPGISTAELQFWDRLPDGKTARGLELEGYLLIGFGGGRFDEHPNEKEKRKEGCAASLVARALRRENDPSWEGILRFTTDRDLKLGGGPYELPAIVKAMNYLKEEPLTVFTWTCDALISLRNQGPQYFKCISLHAGETWALAVEAWAKNKFGESDQKENPILARILSFTAKRREKICGTVLEPHAVFHAVFATSKDKSEAQAWAFQTLDAIYNKEMAFKKAQEDLVRARTSELFAQRKRILLVAGTSDSPFFTSAARSEMGAGVVIQTNSHGNVSIHTDQKLGLDLDDVAAKIRIEEMRCKNRPLSGNRRLLAIEGNMPGCEEWHYFRTGRMLLNGSLSIYAPPTNLSLDVIEQTLRRGLR